MAGIALTAIYAPNGIIGQWFALLDIKIAYTWIGVTVALTFIGLPFCSAHRATGVGGFKAEAEEAAASLGATRWQTFRYIIMPALYPRY